MAKRRDDARTKSPTTIVLIVMAFLLGIGPYAVMFLHQSGDGIGDVAVTNSRSFASPSLLLRRGSNDARVSLPSSPTSSIAARPTTSSIYDTTRAEYDTMLGSEAETQVRDNHGTDTRAQEQKRRKLREIEAERRRNGYPQPKPILDEQPVPVQIIPAKEGKTPSRLTSLINEGIDSSRKLVTRIMCPELVDAADWTMKRRIEEHRAAVRNGLPSPFGSPTVHARAADATSATASSSARLSSALQWKIYIIDFSDYGYVAEDDVYYGIDDFTLDCIKPLSDLLGRRNVYFASREHVLGRNIQRIGAGGEDESKPFGPLGEVIDYQRMHLIHFMMGKVRRIDFGHRTLLEDCLEDEAAKLVETEEKDVAGIDLPSLSRPLDVAHFWKVGNDDNHTSAVRDAVNNVVRSLEKASGTDPHDRVRTYTGHFGDGLGSFKSANVTCPLAREMLRYKIIVVAQKDNYEGHYRLMDALLSGALVLTDPMSRLPLFLEDRVSVVVYRSPAELRRLLQYYLQRQNEKARIEIGRRGRSIALRHHSPAAW
eukprot:CAMPEP_0178546280 /NCGR_PEP_ID=MMETSP0697-20121206/4073_1 /TAXON_ID=265572 /ORGANISM="Extubocellulus spinifer, Strain CCMP396" /LENGTH=539 /DNA_ID=CAMNT_0020178867 /DNA_START=101 /DNA_END=1717 /DNA_ORIENTATION=-